MIPTESQLCMSVYGGMLTRNPKDDGAMAAVRKQILLDPVQNKRLQKLRAATGMSESEIVRRSLDAYDPERTGGLEDNTEVRELLDVLVEQNSKTTRALELAEAEIAATERYLRDLRAERDKASRGNGRAPRKAARAARR